MGLKPKNKGHANFYECCDLTKKVYLGRGTHSSRPEVIKKDTLIKEIKESTGKIKYKKNEYLRYTFFVKSQHS